MQHPSPTPRRLLRRLQLLALALASCGLLGLAPPAHAAKKHKKTTASTTQTSAQHSKRSVKVKPSQNHSGETRAERERRLSRECRGMPNAGACLGYTKR